MNILARSEIDGDLNEIHSAITDLRTSDNRFGINCVDCGRTFFTDQSTFLNFSRKVDHGLDNPFLCSFCEREYEDLAYAVRGPH
ncbi:hypothetical protein BH10ACI2_BH10ACI2_05240 [soil metagenome]